MTRKHFEMIARRLKENRDRTSDKASADILAHELASDLEELNPRFDHTRFLKACGYYDDNPNQEHTS